MSNSATAYLAGGCFWGMQELFRHQAGVQTTQAGYSGGSFERPTWMFHPGHAEALAITYDPSIITYKQLLDFFFRIHDPTTLNSQGNDRGSSYRSAIFYQTEAQKLAAAEMITLVNNSKRWASPVVTTLEPFTVFYAAEPEHQDYLQRQPNGYTCHFVRGGTYLE